MDILPMLRTTTGMIACLVRSQSVCTPVVRIPEPGSQPSLSENRIISMMANQNDGTEIAA